MVTPSGQVVKRFTPQVTGHVALSPSTYQALLTGFTGVVQSPDGHRLRHLPGAELPRRASPARPGRRTPSRARSRPPGSSGFGPTADPQYVVVCVIDQAGYGATAAAPVVRDIYSYLATHPIGPGGPPPPPPSEHDRSTASHRPPDLHRADHDPGAG